MAQMIKGNVFVLILLVAGMAYGETKEKSCELLECKVDPLERSIFHMSESTWVISLSFETNEATGELDSLKSKAGSENENLNKNALDGCAYKVKKDGILGTLLPIAAILVAGTTTYLLYTVRSH